MRRDDLNHNIDQCQVRAHPFPPNDAPLFVHMAKSPSLVKLDVQSDDHKASIYAVEYKAEILLANLEHVIRESVPRRASWSIGEHVMNQISSRRISW